MISITYHIYESPGTNETVPGSVLIEALRDWLFVKTFPSAAADNMAIFWLYGQNEFHSLYRRKKRNPAYKSFPL